MSKSGRNRHKAKGSAGSGGAGSRASAAQSLSAFRAERAVDALTPAYVRWFEEGSPGSAAAALESLVLIKAVMGRYMERTAASDVTRLDAAALAAAVSDELVATLDAIAALAGDAALDVGAVESTNFVVDAVHAFVGFLVETDRWSGSVDQLAEIVDFLDTTAEDDAGWGYVDVPDIPEGQALDVFSGLPLIRRATALLEWIGDGRAVTATGALRLRDIEAAAACVGVAVRGGSKRAGSPTPDSAGSASDVPTVRSMYEVPLLAQMWAALETAELIKITSTKVVPFEGTEDFLAGGPSARLEEMAFYVDQFLVAAVLDYDPAQPWERTLAGLQTSLLIAAATEDPPSLERVLAAADQAPAAEKAMAGLLTGMAISRMEALAELGLLTINTHFRVPPALIRCVATVFDDDRLLAELGLAPAAGGPDVVPGAPAPEMTKAPAPTPQTETPVLQLKIMLNGSKPPIWRRVLVPAGMPLPQLHTVIQTLFGWFDYHLHEFRTGGFRGPAYAPLTGEDDFYGDASHDEATVTVGELLPGAGSSMTYTYDFGDNWVHSIKLEKVLASDDGGGQLPRCTAGRGAAPAEDSGGTWGWANIVEAVNDPRHEEHKEYREWLGMLPGETLDPKAFDLDDVNEDLADLF